MKTSNILFTSAILTVLVSLVFYNLGLKAEYKTIEKIGLSEYSKNNRFNDYEQIKVKTFNRIELVSANTLKVKIEYGENEAVWVGKRVKNRVSIKQTGNTLIVNLNKEGDLSSPGGQAAHVTIISPNLKAIQTKAFKFPVKNGQYYNQWKTSIYGFTQDSLNINIAANTEVWLDNNNLNIFKATVGDQAGDGKLIINANNNIESIKLNAFQKSIVQVLNAKTIIEHHLSDSAIVTFRGMALHKNM